MELRYDTIYENLHLSDLEDFALQPNTTSKLQPLDAGITAAFKGYYRRNRLSWALDNLDDGQNPRKVDQSAAMRWVKSRLKLSQRYSRSS